MYNYKKEIEMIVSELMEIKKKCELELASAPEGKLRVSGRGKSFQCYIKDEAGKDIPGGKYVSKKDIDKARKIAQRDYDKKLLAIVDDVLLQLNKCNFTDLISQISNLYASLNHNRKKLVLPHIISDEEYCEIWLNEDYPKRKFSDDDAEIITENGERVLSKSEKIIADKLFIEGIPYRYEYPLYLHGYGEVHPDFLVLNKRTRTEYYWEHFGMMDDMDYVEKAIKKIETYEKNGFIPGKNLIITHETRMRPLRKEVLNEIINQFFT